MHTSSRLSPGPLALLLVPFVAACLDTTAITVTGDLNAGDLTSGQTTDDLGSGQDASTTTSPDAAFVPITIVQETSTLISPNGNVDPTVSLMPPPVPGNAVIVGITCFSEVDNCTIPPGGVTDNQNNTYLRVVEGNSITSSVTHGARGYIFIAENVRPTNGTFTITVNPNGDPIVQNVTWGVIEVAGLVATGTVDKFSRTAVLSAPSTTVATSMSITLANELAVAVHTMRSNDGDVAYAHDPSWTEHHVYVNGAAVAHPHSMVSKVVNTVGIVSHTWTHDIPSRGASAIIATFKGRSQ